MSSPQFCLSEVSIRQFKAKMMASRVPVVRQIGWNSLVPHLLVMGCLIGTAWFVGLRWYPAIGAGIYLAYSFGSRFFMLRAHRAGMAMVRRERYSEAIPYFRSSYEFFTRHRWVDEWRYLTLLSSSYISHREMALLNLAFCHAQLDHGEKAREYYLQTVREYPDSRMGDAGLRMIEAGRGITESTSVPQ